MDENSTTVAPKSGFNAPLPLPAASEIRLRKKASAKINDSDKDKLMNSGQVSRHKPGSSGSLAVGGTDASEWLPGGCSRGACMRTRRERSA